MNSRPSRSSSIPIPRSTSASSSARNIETLISIPFVSPTTSARQPAPSSSSSRAIVEPRRVGPSADGRRLSITDANTSLSPVRSTARSVSLVSSAALGRGLSRTTFEPRIVRGPGPEQFSNELECLPQPATSPSQNRRVSAGSIRASASGSHPPIVPQHVVAHTTPVSFEKPTYLEYSSFKHLLQTEISAPSLPNRRGDHKLTSGSRNQGYTALIGSPQSENDEDSISILSNTTNRHTLSTVSPSDQIFKLPTRWSEQVRHPSLTVSPDGRELSFHGPSGNGEKDASVARTNYGIPPACGIYYFEVEIMGKEQKAHVCIGFASRNVKTSRLPGLEPNSWGYYGEDGTALTSERGSFSYGPSFGTGDIIGCGIDFANNSAFYTRNGSLLPIEISVGKLPDVYLYPVVGLQYPGEAVRTNFGQDSFKFDIDYHVQQKSNAIWNKIQNTPLDQGLLPKNRRKCMALSIASITNTPSPKPTLTDEQSKDLLNQLVKSYLVHHGYAKTARAFEKQQEGRRSPSLPTTKSTPDVEMSRGDAVENEIESRTHIVNAVLAGDLDSAIDGVKKYSPSVLEADDQLILFKLRCRKFVELILETAEMKKKIKATKPKAMESERRKEAEQLQGTWGEDDMDIDMEDTVLVTPPSTTSFGHLHDSYASSRSPSVGDSAQTNLSSQYESALNAALLYGQTLSNDYQSDTRPECQQLFKKTFGIVAWEDPLEAGGPIADFVGHDSRVALAHELNQAILRSQGLPAQPALETIYRHTAVCINQLGLLGVGAAAYADMQREFIL